MSLIAELKRRNVFRVGVAYAIVAWLLVEVSSVLLPAFKVPEWVFQAFVILVVLGFPLTLVIAWAFEMTPEGLKREAEVDRTESVRHSTGRKLDFAIIGLLVIALIFVVVDNYVLEAEPKQASVAREKSIAVLLFDNLSRDAANEAFTDGIHDDILTQLSKIRALKVIARTSMERLDPGLTIPEIGTQLGVATVLEGGVQRAGEHVRINVQLIDCKTEAHLWAETYDRELTAANIFSIQSEIANIVADALRATLSPEEQERLAAVPTTNLAAYQAYLLGRQRLTKLSTAALNEAVDYFQEAIGLDADFALAYVGLAEALVWLSEVSDLPPEEVLDRAQAATDKALALDDQLGEAYNALAGVRFGMDDLEGAEAASQRALELSPNYAMAYLDYGTILLSGDLGRPEEALELFKKAVELDPLSTAAINFVGRTLLTLGRFEEALSWLEKALEIDPADFRSHQGIGDYYESLGQLDEATIWYAKGLSLDPGNPIATAFMGWLFLDLGDPGQAEFWIERSVELGPELFWSNASMQLLHLYRGDEASAREHGLKAFELWPREWPELTLLRDHALKNGRYAEARTLYEETYPELLNPDDPRIGGRNWNEAIDLALVLSKMGEQEHADLLLERSARHIQHMSRRVGWYALADVQIYALQGEQQEALAALRRAVDGGWRFFWWYFLGHNPNLESLHDEPEFQAMVAEIEADMAAQLARVREMQRSGELEPIPEIPATTHWIPPPSGDSPRGVRRIGN